MTNTYFGKISILIAFLSIVLLPSAYSMFEQPDTLVSDVYDSQDLNRYSFERNNPVNNIDPTGHVAIGFEGFSGWMDDESGVDEIAQQISEEDSSIPVYVYGRMEEGKALKTVKSELSKNPNQPVVIYGHSLGGDSAIELSQKLGKGGIKVDAVYLIDSVGVGDSKQPGNVKSLTNFRQTNTYPKGQKINDKDTLITKKGVTHTNIDSEADVQKTITSGTVKLHQGYKETKTVQPKQSLFQKIVSWFKK